MTSSTVEKLTGKGGPNRGQGRHYEKFTLRRDRQYGVSVTTSTGQFLPLQSAIVEQVDGKAITLILDNGDKLTIFR